MKNKIFATLNEAVADIPDGVTIMFPGFAGVGIPRNLIVALHQQGAKNLTGISNTPGMPDDQVDLGTLNRSASAKKVHRGFHCFHSSFASNSLRPAV